MTSPMYSGKVCAFCKSYVYEGRTCPCGSTKLLNVSLIIEDQHGRLNSNRNGIALELCGDGRIIESSVKAAARASSRRTKKKSDSKRATKNADRKPEPRSASKKK